MWIHGVAVRSRVPHGFRCRSACGILCGSVLSPVRRSAAHSRQPASSVARSVQNMKNSRAARVRALHPIYPVTFVTVLVQGAHIGSRVVASLLALKLGAAPFTIG